MHRASIRSEAENNILQLLAKGQKLSTDEIATKIKSSRDVTQYHLEEMFHDSFVQWSHEQRFAGQSAIVVWSLGHKGVGYLTERGLHK